MLSNNYELNFMHNLLTKGLFKIMIDFSKILRYLDDLLVLDNLLFNLLLYTDSEISLQSYQQKSKDTASSTEYQMTPYAKQKDKDVEIESKVTEILPTEDITIILNEKKYGAIQDVKIESKESEELAYTKDSKRVKGVYPAYAITLAVVDSTLPIQFMDSEINILTPEQKPSHALTGKWFIKCYDKRNNPKFSKLTFIKYPSIYSLTTPESSYNIVLTQCHRFFNLNTFMEDFINNTRQLFAELLSKGFKFELLRIKLKKFILNSSFKNFYGLKPSNFCAHLLKRHILDLHVNE